MLKIKRLNRKSDCDLKIESLIESWIWSEKHPEHCQEQTRLEGLNWGKM